MVFQSISIEPEVSFWLLPETKWKSFSIDVFCKVPVTRRTVTALALASRLSKRGTRSFPSLRELSIRLETLYGAGLGADCSKIGPVQVLRFGIDMTSPTYLRSMVEDISSDLSLRKAMDLVWELTTQPYLVDGKYPEDRFETEKEEHRRSIKAIINDRPKYAMIKLMEAMSGDDPRGLPAWGVLADLDQLSSRETWEIFTRALSSCPISIYAVGEGSSDLGRMLEKEGVQFPFNRSARPLEKKDAPELPEKPLFVEEYLPGDQTIVCMAYSSGVTEDSPDFPAFMVYDGILGGFPHSKLFSTIREKESLAYFADTTLNTWRGLTIAMVGTLDRHRKRVEELIEKEVAAMRRGEISDSELENTRAGLYRRLVSESDSPNAIIKRSLTAEILGGDRDGEKLARKILEVTREDVVRVSEKVQLRATYELRAENQE